jgi:hypothetical protein
MQFPGAMNLTTINYICSIPGIKKLEVKPLSLISMSYPKFQHPTHCQWSNI